MNHFRICNCGKDVIFTQSQRHRRNTSAKIKLKTTGRVAMGRQRASTSFSLFLSVAFACIVGSEHGRVSSRPRASNGGYHDLIKRFFGGLYGKPAKPLLTDDQIDSYVRDGFVVVSGLLDADEIERLLGAGESIVSKHAEKLGGQLPPKNFQVHEFALALNDDRFRDIALHSKLPRAAAELMQLDSESQNLRVLRYVSFSATCWVECIW